MIRLHYKEFGTVPATVTFLCLEAREAWGVR